jgi:hypothetical protein
MKVTILFILFPFLPLLRSEPLFPVLPLSTARLLRPPCTLLATRGKLFEKVILKTFQRHTEEIFLFNASPFGFCGRHSTTLQCMRLTDHVTLNFNNNMPTTAVFFDTTWHPALLYKLSKLKLSISLIGVERTTKVSSSWI